jgi:aarF domain-containing kinase
MPFTFTTEIAKAWIVPLYKFLHEEDCYSPRIARILLGGGGSMLVANQKLKTSSYQLTKAMCLKAARNVATGREREWLAAVLPSLRPRNVVLSLVALSLFAFTMLCILHPGIRRTIHFWKNMLPIITEYNWLKLCKRWSPGLHQERLRSFHLRCAPRITNTMVEMGGIYIKLGQVMSTMGAGLLDKAYVEAFRTLQNGVPPKPYDAIAGIIEKSSGKKMADVFDHFEKLPVGAASIGQAHRAVLKATSTSGPQEVIVKVQYPEVARLFQVDFDNMETIVKWMEPDNTGLVQSLRKRHENELDFRVEADNLREITRNMQGHGVEPSMVRLPRVFNETGICSENVLVMEYLEGTSLASAIENEQDRLAKALGQGSAEEFKTGLMKKMKEHFEQGGGEAGNGGLMMGGKLLQSFGPAAAGLLRAYGGFKEQVDSFAWSLQRAGAKVGNLFSKEEQRVLLKGRPKRSTSNVNIGRALKTLTYVHGLQMIKDGVFNLDPHPGNVLVLGDGRLGLLDYGMVGRLNEEDRMQVAKTIMALSRQDASAVAQIYTNAGYRATNKDGDINDHGVLHRFATFHFDRVDLSPISVKHSDGVMRKMDLFKVMESSRERALPFWIENGRRLGGLLIGEHFSSHKTSVVGLCIL